MTSTAMGWLTILVATNVLNYVMTSEAYRHKGYDQGFNDYKHLHRSVEGEEAELLDLPTRLEGSD